MDSYARACPTLARAYEHYKYKYLDKLLRMLLQGHGARMRTSYESHQKCSLQGRREKKKLFYGPEHVNMSPRFVHPISTTRGQSVTVQINDNVQTGRAFGPS